MSLILWAQKFESLKEMFKPGFFNLLSYISKKLTHDVKIALKLLCITLVAIP